VYGECDNFHVIQSAHSGAILDLQFVEDGSAFLTTSTDKTVGVFDTATGNRIKRLKGHTNYVNSVSAFQKHEAMLVSGSDDCTVKVWDRRKRTPAHTVNNVYQVTSVTYGDSMDSVISGGIDNVVKVEKAYVCDQL